MYVAGWSNITLLWGAIVAVGYFSMYAIEALAPAFADDYPWYPGLLWFGLAIPGMIGSSIIGHRASKQTQAALRDGSGSPGLRLLDDRGRGRVHHFLRCPACGPPTPTLSPSGGSQSA